MMAAAVCSILELSQLPDNVQMEEWNTMHVCREAGTAYLLSSAVPSNCIVHRLQGDVRDAASQRAEQIIW